MTHAGHVVSEAGHTWWKCPFCGRKLAELVNGNAVIKAGPRYLVIRLANDQMQRCPAKDCGQLSELRVADVAA